MLGFIPNPSELGWSIQKTARAKAQPSLHMITKAGQVSSKKQQAKYNSGGQAALPLLTLRESNER